MDQSQLHEETVFNVARKIGSQEAREKYLQEACDGDVCLYERVQALLAANITNDELFELHAFDATQPIQEGVGTVVGPYRLREQIGEGGMGVVFVADQRLPIARKVALKIIKAGMDTKQVVARFEAERQALAIMDHPNIAKVIDAGSTATGRPYFVMELIRGVPITEYCDHLRLGTRERLGLFERVCEAVQHAHLKGVIHRDLKPANILVTEIDGAAIPKVIDFGVAKATTQSLTTHSIYTQFSQVIGTPLYMSPEQAGMSSDDVDTRTDVYSLGVLLYELLTGKTPFDRDDLRAVSLEEMRRIIREVDPPRPSLRFSTLKASESSTISERRSIDSRQLHQQFRGELDLIVMKALEKDRKRRYESATALKEDVERFVNNEPVNACPPTFGYQLSKFAKRHQKLLITVLATSMLLITATILSVVFALEANEATKEARFATKQAEVKTEVAKTAEALAKRRLQQSQADLARGLQSLDTIVDVITAPELDSIPNANDIRRQVLDQAMSFYEEILVEHDNSPEVRLQYAWAYFRIADLYSGHLDNQDKALNATQQSLEILKQLCEEFPDELEYQRSLVVAYRKLGQRRNRSKTQRLQDHQTAVDILRKNPELLDYVVPHEVAQAFIEFAEKLPLESKQAEELINESIRHMRARELPPRPSAFRWLGKKAKESKDFLVAADYFQKSASGFDNSAQDREKGYRLSTQFQAIHMRIAAAQVLKQANKSKDAENIFRSAFHEAKQVYRQYPSNTKANQMLTWSAQALSDHLYQNGGEPEHREIWTTLYTEFPGFIGNRYYQARFLLKSANPIAALTEAIRNSPGTAAYYRFRGEAYKDRDMLELALADFNKTEELATNLEKEVFQSRGDVLQKLNRPREALADYDAYLERSDQSHIHKRKARTLFGLREWKSSIAELRLATVSKPEELSNLTWIPPFSIAICENKEYQEAYLELVDQVVELNFNSLPARATRAEIWLEFNKTDEAYAEFRNVLDQGNGDYYHRFLTALLAIHHGDEDRLKLECKSMLASATEIGQNRTRAYFAALACVLKPGILKDYDSLARIPAVLCALEPKKPEFRRLEGTLLYRFGKYEEAKTKLLEALELGGVYTDVNTSYLLALTEHQLGNAEEALSFLRAARNGMTKKLPENRGRGWRNRMITELLEDEAREKLGAEVWADFDTYSSNWSHRWYAYCRQLKSHFNSGDYESALQDLKSALELDPTDIRIFNSVTGQIDDTPFRKSFLEYLDKTVELNSESTEARFTRASLWLDCGKAKLAYEEFKAILDATLDAEEVGTKNVIERTQLIRVLTALLASQYGDEERAKLECLRMVASVTDVEKYPNHAFYAAWLCVMNPDLCSDFSKVTRIGEKLYAMDSQNHSYLRCAGALRYRLGDYDQAKLNLLQSIETNVKKSNITYTYYFLALTEYQLGNAEAAHKYWATARIEAAEKKSNRMWLPLKFTELFENEVRKTFGTNNPLQ